MSTVSSPEPLPNDPSLEQLRKQARELQRDKRVADPAFPLSSAQREIALSLRLRQLAAPRPPPRGRRPLHVAA